MQIIRNIFITITTAIITVVFSLAFLTLPLFGNHKILVVLSDSMKPLFYAGSLILVHPSPTYTIGDVISFQLPKAKQFVTHRIVSISEDNVYQTKGDANRENDGFTVLQEQIIGKQVGTLPYAGRIVSFAKSKQGIAILILIPALVTLFSELAYLLSKLRFPLRSEAFFLAGLLVGSATAVGSTHAFFNDTAASTNNIFQASQTFPNVVINEVYYDVCTPASTCGNNPQNEWIELYNPTSTTIDLTGWTVTDNNSSDTIPSGTNILAGSFLIVTPESQTFNVWTGVPVSQRVILGSNIGNGLADSGDRVILKNASGSIVDSMSYGDDTSQLNPSETDVAKGHSLERDPDGVDTNTNADFVDRTTPTPGS